MSWHCSSIQFIFAFFMPFLISWLAALYCLTPSASFFFNSLRCHHVAYLGRMSLGGAHPSPCLTTADVLHLGGSPWSRTRGRCSSSGNSSALAGDLRHIYTYNIMYKMTLIIRIVFKMSGMISLGVIMSVLYGHTAIYEVFTT